MSTLKKYGLSSALVFGLPLVASAQNITVQDPGIQTLLENIFNVVAPILITLIILYILFGAFRFATAGGDEEARENGKNILLYGAIGLVIIGSLLGLVSFVLQSVQVSGTPDTNVPGFNN